MRDVRSPDPYFSQLCAHKQEVCGLKFSFDERQLASGGNDNKVRFRSRIMFVLCRCDFFFVFASSCLFGT